jgi:hypothetical protein
LILPPLRHIFSRRAAAKAISRVLGKKIKPGLNLLHTPAAKKKLYKRKEAQKWQQKI